MTGGLSLASDVAAFWRAAGPDLGFAKHAEFDVRCRDAGLDLHMQVAARRHDDWLGEPVGALALALLCGRPSRHRPAFWPISPPQ